MGCFQPLKWYYGRVLDWAARTGAKDVNKADFLATLGQIRAETFRAKTIRKGWAATGIYLFKLEVVISKLRI